MKNRLVLVLSREMHHWVVVATYENIFRANQHYASIVENERVTGKMMLVWDMFYGIQIDRIDWDDMKCGGRIESINLPFDCIKSSERGQIYMEVYQAITQYVA